MSVIIQRTSRLLPVLGLLSFLLGGHAGAQEIPTANQHVRVWVSTEPDTPLFGTLVSVTEDHLTIDVPTNSGYTSQALAISAIERLEVSDGYERTGDWKRGAAIGGGIGFAVGGLVGLIAREIQREGDQVQPLVTAAAGALVGGTAGAIIGTGPKQERWREVPIESIRVGLSVDGVSLGFVVSTKH